MPFSAYLKAGLFVVAAAAALFAAAGTIAIPGFSGLSRNLRRRHDCFVCYAHPDLLRERMRPGGKKPPLSLRILSLVLFMHWIVAAARPCAVSIGATQCPAGCKVSACSRSAAGHALALWAMRVNRFFSSVIRIQTDRGQHVVTTGPYAFVRHPGYTAGILIIVASGPALGSWLAAGSL